MIIMTSNQDRCSSGDRLCFLRLSDGLFNHGFTWSVCLRDEISHRHFIEAVGECIAVCAGMFILIQFIRENMQFHIADHRLVIIVGLFHTFVY